MDETIRSPTVTLFTITAHHHTEHWSTGRTPPPKKRWLLTFLLFENQCQQNLQISLLDKIHLLYGLQQKSCTVRSLATTLITKKPSTTLGNVTTTAQFNHYAHEI